MAIYHLSAKIVSRSTGRSSVAAAAYRAGQRLRDERTGLDHDYTRKSEVAYREIAAPESAPSWMHDRGQLWNSIERVEKRRDAQLSRELEIALPHELTREGQIELVREFVADELVAKGMIADWSLHLGTTKDGHDQPHIHIMLTTRELLGDGFGGKNRDWNRVEQLERWRTSWAERANRVLEREGHAERIDHRTLDAQRDEAERRAHEARQSGNQREADQHERRADRLRREPEPKLGPTAANMERAGHRTRRGDEWRAVRERNLERWRTYRHYRHLARALDRTVHGIERITEASASPTQSHEPDELAVLKAASDAVIDVARILGRSQARAVPERTDPRTLLSRTSPRPPQHTASRLLGRERPETEYPCERDEARDR